MISQDEFLYGCVRDVVSQYINSMYTDPRRIPVAVE